MKYVSLKDQLFKERQKNAALRALAGKNEADIDYIAMMCDVELESPEEFEMQNAEDFEEV